MGLAERGRGQIMNLNFDETLATNYKSFSQKVRVMSECWFLENLFCPCCGNSCINKIKNNAPVADTLSDENIEKVLEFVKNLIQEGLKNLSIGKLLIKKFSRRLTN